MRLLATVVVSSVLSGCSLIVDGSTPSTDAAQNSDGTEIDGASESPVRFIDFTPGSLAGDDISIAVPETTEPGDLLIAALAVDAGTQGLAPQQTGWETITERSSEGRVALGVYWRVADEVDSYRFSVPVVGGFPEGPADTVAWLMQFTAPNGAPVVGETDSTCGFSARPPSPSVDAAAGSLVLRLGAFDTGQISGGETGLPGHTDILMADDRGVAGGAGYQVREQAGPTGEAAFDLWEQDRFCTASVNLMAPE